MDDILYCPGIRTMLGFCPEVEEADDGGRLVCLYRDLKTAQASIAKDAVEWARQAVEGEREWSDALSFIESLEVVEVQLDEIGAAFAFCHDEGVEGLPETIDYGYLDPMPENPEDGWLADKGGYIIEGEGS